MLVFVLEKQFEMNAVLAGVRREKLTPKGARKVKGMVPHTPMLR